MSLSYEGLLDALLYICRSVSGSQLFCNVSLHQLQQRAQAPYNPKRVEAVPPRVAIYQPCLLPAKSTFPRRIFHLARLYPDDYQ